MASAEDRIANIVLQECCQVIVDHINVDEIIMRLHSKSRLTLQQVALLDSFPTAQEKKRQLYILALADKGSSAFKDIVEVLKDTANYKPHADLVDKLIKHHSRCVSHNEHVRTQEINTAELAVNNREELTATPCLDSRLSDDRGDDDQLQSLPDIAIVTTQNKQSRTLVIEQKVPSPTNTPDHNTPATNMVLSLSLQSSKATVTQLLSSIQNVDSHVHTTRQQPSSAKV